MSGTWNIPHPHNEPVLSYAPGENPNAAYARAEAAVDCQRHGLGHTRVVAGEHDGGSELPERSRPSEDRAGDEAGGDQGQRDRPKYLAGRRSQIGRGGFDIADYSRAAEWTETALRWCEREEIAGFPGMSRSINASMSRMIPPIARTQVTP